MNELIAKIEQWAEDRNLIKSSTPLDQAMKLFSEFGELADAVAKDDLEGIKDGIGDVFVVLTIICKQHECWITNYLSSLIPALVVKDAVCELNENIAYFIRDGELKYLSEDNESLSMCIALLESISGYYKLTLQQCVQHAYNDIKDRKGIMHSGVFIKESDPRYAELVNV